LRRLIRPKWRWTDEALETTQVPVLREIVSTRCAQPVASAALPETLVPQGEQGGESAPLAREIGEPRLLPRGDQRGAGAGLARRTSGVLAPSRSPTQSTFIPLGVGHRLENPGKTPLYIVEV